MPAARARMPRAGAARLHAPSGRGGAAVVGHGAVAAFVRCSRGGFDALASREGRRDHGRTRFALEIRMPDVARKRSRREGGMNIDYLSLETAACLHSEDDRHAAEMIVVVCMHRVNQPSLKLKVAMRATRMRVARLSRRRALCFSLALLRTDPPARRVRDHRYRATRPMPHAGVACRPRRRVVCFRRRRFAWNRRHTACAIAGIGRG
ncbi:hypothetical protein EMIT0111MI5_290043 [Burkholderia sp. IT-111MI5]